jgi:hypothetical protein
MGREPPTLLNLNFYRCLKFVRNLDILFEISITQVIRIQDRIEHGA